jgi:ParB-like chromosome segregation protein Spo0J
VIFRPSVLVLTKIVTREGYVTLIPPVSTDDYERLKASIKEEGGLLFPIIINQNNVVLDGHHRLRACKEIGIPISYNTRDFTDKPLEELKFVVSSNLNRRHLDEFQKAHVAIKYDSSTGRSL